MLATTERYVAAWVALGALLLTATLLVVGFAGPAPLTIAAIVALVALAEFVELDFQFERAYASFTLIEVAITAGLLLLPPAEAVVAAVIGATLTHLLRRLGATRVLFNSGQLAAGVSVAALVTVAVPDVGPAVGDRPVLGAVLGMVAYVLVNLTAMAGLFRRFAGAEASEGLRSQVPLTAAMQIGQIATGVVLATVAATNLALAPFVIAPAAAVYLAARGSRRASELLLRVRSERDRLTRIVDGASDGILLLDGTGRIQVFNPAMEAMTGHDAHDAVGRPIAEVLDDDTRAGALPVRGRWLIDDAHLGPARRELDAMLTHADGTVRAIRESHALVFDERGRCTGDVVVVRDVSRQQELERLRSDFVARVSHELRTPLTPIRGFASVLLRRGDALDPAQRREALERILERSDHLGQLVEDLLLVTRLDRGELDDVAHPRPVAIEGAVEAAVATARSRDPARDITVDVAPGTSPALADPARVEQILTALLDNACRYTPDGGPIEVDVSSVGDDVRVRVSDHGPGIPRDRREAIFERFHRLEDPLTMRTGGVGLGLFLARSLAVAMHGSLTLADPQPGGGASFVLSLPTAEPARARDDATGNPSAPPVM